MVKFKKEMARLIAILMTMFSIFAMFAFYKMNEDCKFFANHALMLQKENRILSDSIITLNAKQGINNSITGN